MTAVGFEPTQLALVELESTPLDHSGKLSLQVAEESIASQMLDSQKRCLTSMAARLCVFRSAWYLALAKFSCSLSLRGARMRRERQNSENS